MSAPHFCMFGTGMRDCSCPVCTQSLFPTLENGFHACWVCQGDDQDAKLHTVHETESQRSNVWNFLRTPGTDSEKCTTFASIAMYIHMARKGGSWPTVVNLTATRCHPNKQHVIDAEVLPHVVDACKVFKLSSYSFNSP